jgi:phage portal protein BeeE
LADAWVTARESNAIASLNQYVDFVESSASPEKLQHLESRQHQALELARLCNIPPYLVGAPASNSMTYQNAAQAAADAVTFGALPYLEVIEGTLSSEQVTPRGRIVRLDRSAWLDNPLSVLDTVPAEPVGRGGTP